MSPDTEVGELIVAEFAKIASGIYLEGLAIDEARDAVWYSDVIGGGIHGLRRDGTPIASLDLERMWSGGIMMNQDGAVLSTGEGGIRWNQPETGRSGWLIDNLDDRPINGINEMVPDDDGGIVFGTTDIEMVSKGAATRPTELWHLNVDGGATRLADGIGFANGLAYDAARRRLYCNDTFHGTLVFDVADGFSLKNRRVFLEKEDVDGMALDEDGNVWITGFRSSFVTRVTPDGRLLDNFSAPGGSVTQLRFGGPDSRDVYLNSVPSNGGDTLKEGGEMVSKGSFLYCGRSDVPGVRLAPTGFNLV